jgi:TrmH family RNA methyltransferase
MVLEAGSYASFKTLVLSSSSNILFPHKAKQIFYADEALFKKITGLENPEFFAAEIEIPTQPSLENEDLILVLDGISDPGNLGTILRSGLALGWESAFILSGSADPYNEKALRAAKGATFRMKIQQGSWSELELLLKTRPFQLLAADLKGTLLEKCQIQKPLMLVLGNEAHGPRDQWQGRCQCISIPISDKMDSLNVAAAGAILMHSIKGML